MKKINIRFEQDKTLDTVDIVIRAASRDAQVDALMESLAQREPVRLTVLYQANCPTVIDEKDIVLISADGKNIRIVTLRDVFHAKQSLQSVEGILSGNFLRVSRFEIINLKMVRKYDFTLVGTLRIEFENGMETCRALEDAEERFSCFDALKLYQYKKNKQLDYLTLCTLF